MTGSTAPCTAEPGSRPSPQSIARDYLEAACPAAIPGVRWDAIHRSTFPYIETPQFTRRLASGMALPRSLAARLRTLAPDDEELGNFLEDLALAVRGEQRVNVHAHRARWMRSRELLDGDSAVGPRLDRRTLGHAQEHFAFAQLRNHREACVERVLALGPGPEEKEGAGALGLTWWRPSPEGT